MKYVQTCECSLENRLPISELLIVPSRSRVRVHYDGVIIMIEGDFGVSEIVGYYKTVEQIGPSSVL